MLKTAYACLFAVLLTTSLPSVADECEDDVSECLADTEAAGEACYEGCDDAGSSSERRECRVRCETRLTRREQQCTSLQRECESKAAASDDAALFGSQRSGAEGCYFGECPDGTGKRSTPSKRTPRREPKPDPEDEYVEEDDNAWTPQQAAATTAICQTPTFWCQMYMRGPVGYPCYCNSLFGPVDGITVPERR